MGNPSNRTILYSSRMLFQSLCSKRLYDKLCLNITRTLRSIRVPESNEISKTTVVANRRVPPSPLLQRELLNKKPAKVLNSRILKVAILGLPNAGKSTLVNQLAGWKTCPVSKKVHTTRKMARAVAMHGSSQIVILDTPGLVMPSERKKYCVLFHELKL